MKKLITKFNHSAIMMEELNAYRKSNKKPELCFKTIIEIRWNSVYLAIERFLELSPEMSKVIIDENQRKSQREVILLFSFSLKN